jgi:putative endonuclease
MRRRGSDAEDRAAAYLLAKGYTLIGRRVTTRSGELDVVALDGETLVAVEVRARRRGAPELSVGPAKYARLLLALEEYAREAGAEGRPRRLDLIAIDGEGLRHYENAQL